MTMNPTLRNVLAVLVGATVCILLNGLLLQALMSFNPPPDGFDPNKPETFGLLQAKHLMNAFAAHAVPTVIGGMLASLLAVHRRRAMAIIVGALHMVGGILAALMIPAPAWFVVLDLTMAYLPMAWLGHKLAQSIR